MSKSKWTNKLGTTPPTSVCFTLTQEDDDGSELTEDNDNHYHKHSTTRRTAKRELHELKEKVDVLSSRLLQCEAENEVLQAEKAVLVNEVAHEQQQRQRSSPSQPTTRRSWFSTKGGVGDMNNSNNNNNGGSMQLLIDTNARLMLDNARLEVMVDAIRKSFESYIMDSRRNSAEDKATIKSLLRLSTSERTRETCPLGNSFVTDTKAPAVEVEEDCHPPALNNNNNSNINDSSEVDDEAASIHQEEIMLRKSLDSIPEVDKLLFGTSGDDWIIEGEDTDDNEGNIDNDDDFWRGSTPLMLSLLIKDDENENNETSTSAVVPVAVADQQQQPCTSIAPASPSQDTNTTAIEESALISKGPTASTTRTTRRKSLDLLVEFGETERDKSRIGGERRGRSNSLMEHPTRSRAIGERRDRSISLMELNRYFSFHEDTTTTTTTANCDQEDIDVVPSRKAAKCNGRMNRRPSGRLCHSLTEGTSVGGRKNEDVIVDFPQRKTRILWSSLKS